MSGEQRTPTRREPAPPPCWLILPEGWNDPSQRRDVFGGTTNNPVHPCVPAPLGSGPDDETCGSCAHRVRVQHGGRRYQKCGEMRRSWTHGPGSDIKAAWLACHQWEPIE